MRFSFATKVNRNTKCHYNFYGKTHLRRCFAVLLCGCWFQNVSESGCSHWNMLCQRWLQGPNANDLLDEKQVPQNPYAQVRLSIKTVSMVYDSLRWNPFISQKHLEIQVEPQYQMTAFFVGVCKMYIFFHSCFIHKTLPCLIVLVPVLLYRRRVIFPLCVRFWHRKNHSWITRIKVAVATTLKVLYVHRTKLIEVSFDLIRRLTSKVNTCCTLSNWNCYILLLLFLVRNAENLLEE